MTNKFVDFHAHSTASDGTLTPRELAGYAAEKGLIAAAKTDHDTIDGTAEFFDECKKLGVEPVSGVEMSAKYSCELHIVGLFVDINSPEFCEKLETLKNSRLIRNKQMLDALKQNGMEISEKTLLENNPGKTLKSLGRPHFACEMVANGYVSDINEAFLKYLGRGKSCYVKRISFTPEECIEIIKNAGGLAILAHPIYITQDKDELFELFKKLKNCGLDGAECYYGAYTREFSELCLSLCEKTGLLPSGGSDFHGANRTDTDLGCANVPYTVFENMKHRKEGL